MNYNLSQIDKDLETFYKKIGQNVKKARKSRNISQMQLAELLNFKSVASISNAEIYYNKRHFNLAQLYKISVVLNIDIEVLLKK